MLFFVTWFVIPAKAGISIQLKREVPAQRRA